MNRQIPTIELSQKKGLKRSHVQRFLRRSVDVFLSTFLLLLLLPVFLVFIVLIRLTSGCPVFYLQERIGLNGQPFKIIKFRSMYVDAEKNGPGLSSDTDHRVTKLGCFMRKKKIDELPQLFNVLKGEMTFVGPRPERQYYIDQIIQINPEYLLLHNIKPGITSLGQVKFGYASSVDGMLERMKLDLHYLENKSLAYDLKILWLTFMFLLKGKTK